MPKFFCEYCGTNSSSIEGLTANSCIRHPNGPSKGKHKLYEGNEKSQYSCKYCGTNSSSIQSLTANTCIRHPNGASKGHHSPAL